MDSVIVAVIWYHVWFVLLKLAMSTITERYLFEKMNMPTTQEVTGFKHTDLTRTLHLWRDVHFASSLQWRHNERDGVSNHMRFDCLLNRWFRSIWKKTSEFRVNGLYEGNPPVTGGFPSEMASNIWWRHHDVIRLIQVNWNGAASDEKYTHAYAVYDSSNHSRPSWLVGDYEVPCRLQDIWINKNIFNVGIQAVHIMSASTSGRVFKLFGEHLSKVCVYEFVLLLAIDFSQCVPGLIIVVNTFLSSMPHILPWIILWHKSVTFLYVVSIALMMYFFNE